MNKTQILYFITLLQIGHPDETIVFDDGTQKFYFHFTKDGKDYLKDVGTNEITEGASGELLYNKAGEPNLSQITTKTQPKSSKTTTKNNQDNNQITTKLQPKNKQKDNIHVPEVTTKKVNGNLVVKLSDTFEFNSGHFVTKQSFVVKNTDCKLILETIEAIQDNMHNRLKERSQWDKKQVYTMRDLCEKYYEPAVKYAHKEQIDKLTKCLVKFQNSEKKQLKKIEHTDYEILEKEKKERNNKRMIFVIVGLFILSLILFANIRNKKKKNRNKTIITTEKKYIKRLLSFKRYFAIFNKRF
jgi:hypothetical protein